MNEIKKIVLKANIEICNVFNNKIIPELKSNGIYLLKWNELKKSEKDYVTKYFEKNVYPILTPLGIDSGHRFPYISNLSKSLGISLLKKEKKGRARETFCKNQNSY